MVYLLDFSGVTKVTEEFFNSIPKHAFTSDLEEFKSGKTVIMSEEQIEFYNNHKNYDPIHLFTTSEYTDQEIENNVRIKNNEIESSRQTQYKMLSDPLYMGYVKNMALGNDEKATEYYNKWLEAIQTIKEENPYIE